MPPYAPLMERFFKYVTPTDGCWNWQGALKRHGYSALWDGANGAEGYRISYEAFVGPIPEGLHLDHLCTNTSCVRPDHLEAVTRGENVLRGISPPAKNARKTDCVHGHPFSGANLIVRKGYRICRTCEVRRWKASKLKQKLASQ